jgi:formate hydrogenlyase subunit 4
MWHTVLDPSFYIHLSQSSPGVQVPDGPIQAPPGPLAELAGKLIGMVKWGALVAGVLGMLTCAVMVIIGRMRNNATAVSGLVGTAWVIGGLALASGASALVGAFAAFH